MSERRPVRWRDAALPGALAFVGVVEFSALAGPGWEIGALLEVLCCALLVGRRRYPLVLPTASGLVLLAMAVVGPGLDMASMPIPMLLLAVFALARWNADLRGLLGVSLILGAAVVDILFIAVEDEGWPDVVFVAALAAPPYVLGRLLRQLTDQQALLEQQQELIRDQAVRDERDRIARELHDVVAHSVSAMVVQTAAAQDLVETDPGRARQLLAGVADTGRKALSETGRLLHVIRDDADELGLRPAPGLAELPELVREFRDRGLDVTVELPDPVPVLPAGVDVSAYRISHEVLTNALRYAADGRASLQLRTSGSSLEIRSSNASNGRSGDGSGLGLLGVAERVSVLGGTLEHSTSEGRFELDATLPVTGP